MPRNHRTLVNACPSHGALLVGVGGGRHHGAVALGGDGGEGADDVDAGSAAPMADLCVLACNAMHPAVATTTASYLACYRGQCLPSCT